jgi:hypothetical protein
MSNAANAIASAAPKSSNWLMATKLTYRSVEKSMKGHGPRTIEQQRHALALPRRHVDVGKAELPLKAVVLAHDPADLP